MYPFIRILVRNNRVHCGSVAPLPFPYPDQTDKEKSRN